MIRLGQSFPFSIIFFRYVGNNVDSRYLVSHDYHVLGEFLLVRGLCATSECGFRRADLEALELRFNLLF